MRDPGNVRELVAIHPDYIGFIFYPKSKRFIGTDIPAEIQALIPDTIQKVGVFVDEPFDSLVKNFQRNRLDIVQLHGAELPDYCQKLKDQNIPVIKVFSISSGFDFGSVECYDQLCDYYLFDTATALRGGSGLKFDWRKLNEYRGNKPFFLSGGIQPADIVTINQISHDRLHGIDLNSGFEIGPGLKDIPRLKSFIEKIHDKSRKSAG